MRTRKMISDCATNWYLITQISKFVQKKHFRWAANGACMTNIAVNEQPTTRNIYFLPRQIIEKCRLSLLFWCVWLLSLLSWIKKNGYDRHGRVLAQSPQLLKVKENLNKPHANYIAHSTKSAWLTVSVIKTVFFLASAKTVFVCVVVGC